MKTGKLFTVGIIVGVLGLVAAAFFLLFGELFDSPPVTERKEGPAQQAQRDVGPEQRADEPRPRESPRAESPPGEPVVSPRQPETQPSGPEATVGEEEDRTVGPAPDGSTVHGVVVDRTSGEPLAGQTVVLSSDVTGWAWSVDTFRETRERILANAEAEVAQIEEGIAAIDERLRELGRKLSRASREERGKLHRELERLRRKEALLSESRLVWVFVSRWLEDNPDPRNLPLDTAAEAMVRLQLARESAREVAGLQELDGEVPEQGLTLRATSGEDGSFRFENVSMGMFGLFVRSEEYQSANTTILSLQPGSEHEVSLGVVPAARFTGTVREAGSGSPIPGAQVRLLPVAQDGETLPFQMPGAPDPSTPRAREVGDYDSPPESPEDLETDERVQQLLAQQFGGSEGREVFGGAMTDDQGRFVVRASQVPGSYRLLAWADEYEANETTQVYEIEQGEAIEADIELHGLTGIRVTVRGKPLAEMEPPPAELRSEAEEAGEAETDEPPAPAAGIVAPEQAGELQPVYNAIVRLLTPRQARRAGLSEEWDGNWDPDALEVRGRGFGMPRPTRESDFLYRTDRDGEVFVAGLNPNREYRIKARKRGYQASEEIILSPERREITEVELILEPGGQVVGVVLGEAAEPVEGARVWAAPEDGSRRSRGSSPFDQIEERDLDEEGNPTSRRYVFSGRTVTTDEHGRFHLSGLDDEHPLTLHVHAVGYEKYEQRDVRPEPGTPLEVQLTPVPRVEGWVERPDGALPGANLQVNLRPAGEDRSLARMFTREMRERRSNPTREIREDGSFVFVDVAPGSYIVEAFDESSSPSYSEEFEVREGRSVHDVVVTLRIGATIRGTVVDEMGNPVQGALVTVDESTALLAIVPLMMRDAPQAEEAALDPRARAMARQFSATVSFDDGTFVMENVPAGEFELVAAHNDYPRGRSERITVSDGEEMSGVRVTMGTGATLTGVVLNPDGSPRGGEGVVAFDPDAGFAAMGSATRARADEQGRFEMRGIEPGTYTVAAESMFGGSGARIPPKQVTLGEREHLEIVLGGEPEGGASVYGQVLRNGEPQAGARVSITGSRIALQRQRADEDGRFQFVGLPPGRYLVVLERNREAQSVMVRYSDVEVLFAFDDGGVSGVVTDADNNPLVGARVALNVDTSAEAPEDITGLAGLIRESNVFEARTDEEGRYRIRNVPVGRYRLIVRHEGFAMHQQSISIGQGMSERNITLDGEGGSIVIQITGHAPDQESFFRGYVRLEQADGQAMTLGQRDHVITGSEFRFDDLAPGTYNVVVTQTGSVPERRNGIRVRSGEASTVTFEMEQAGTLEVTVHGGGDAMQFALLDPEALRFELVDASGTPVEQVITPMDVLASLFQMQLPGEDPEETTHTITMSSVPAGDYTFRLQAEGFQEIREPVSIRPGETTELDVTLRPR